MKIGELNEHCGNCLLIGYCTEPYFLKKHKYPKISLQMMKFAALKYT